MKKKVIVMLLLLLLFAACKKEQKTIPVEEPTVDSMKSAPIDTSGYVDHSHNSQNSLDWFGTYTGVIPCGDCPGIETELTLRKDNTYTLSTLYKDREKNPTIKEGTFTWNTSGSIIKLDAKAGGTQYLVKEGSVNMLDAEGKEIDGPLAEAYVLSK